MTFPCAKCGRFYFPKPDTTCFWCQGGETHLNPSPKQKPVAPAGRPTLDQLRQQKKPQRRRGAR